MIFLVQKQWFSIIHNIWLSVLNHFFKKKIPQAPPKEKSTLSDTDLWGEMAFWYQFLVDNADTPNLWLGIIARWPAEKHENIEEASDWQVTGRLFIWISCFRSFDTAFWFSPKMSTSSLKDIVLISGPTNRDNRPVSFSRPVIGQLSSYRHSHWLKRTSDHLYLKMCNRMVL